MNKTTYTARLQELETRYQSLGITEQDLAHQNKKLIDFELTRDYDDSHAGLSTRAINGLWGGINQIITPEHLERAELTLRHLSAFTADELKLFRNIGSRSIFNIIEVMDQNGCWPYNAKEAVIKEQLAAHIKPSLNSKYIDNINDMFKETEGEVSIVKNVDENVLDVTALKKQIEAQGYKVELQLKITKPGQK